MYTLSTIINSKTNQNSTNKKSPLNYYSTIFKERKRYFFHCEYHLGDSVFNVIWFNRWKTYIEDNGIIIFYYVAEQYITQLQEFVTSNNIILQKIEEKPKYSLHLWMGEPEIKNRIFKASNIIHVKDFPLNIYLARFYNTYLRDLSIYNISTMKSFTYEDSTLLDVYETLDEKYKDVDILVINSLPRSNQFIYNKAEWDSFIIKLSTSGFKIIYTTPSSALTNFGLSEKCTMNDNLTIKQLASISTKSKIIIAVNSGVMPGVLNIYTLSNVRQVYIFDNIWRYNYLKFQSKTSPNEININELKSLLL
jgi:hypothetical protein